MNFLFGCREFLRATAWDWSNHIFCSSLWPSKRETWKPIHFCPMHKYTNHLTPPLAAPTPQRSVKLGLWTEISAQRWTVRLPNYIYEISLFSFPILSLSIRCLPFCAHRNSFSLDAKAMVFWKRCISITKEYIAKDWWFSTIKYHWFSSNASFFLLCRDVLCWTGMEINIKWATYEYYKRDGSLS